MEPLSEKELLCATGLTAVEFDELLAAFLDVYERQHRRERTQTGSVRQRGLGGGCKGRFDKDRDKLWFILAYLKTNPRQTVMAKPCMA